MSLLQSFAVQLPSGVAFSASVSLCKIPHTRSLTSVTQGYVMFSHMGERLRQWAAFEYVLSSRVPLDEGMHLRTFPYLGSSWPHSRSKPKLISCVWPIKSSYLVLWGSHCHVRLLVCEHHPSPALDFMCSPHSRYLKENLLE